MYTRPARRGVAYGLAGARDRQISADRHDGPYTEFLRRHEREAKEAAQGTRRDQEEFAAGLLPRAADPRNVMLALEHCAARGRAAGPNGLRPTDLDQEARWDLARMLSPLIRDSVYQPSDPREIQIDKGSGRGHRTIHIQDFQDRIVERAGLQVIRPILQEQFLDCSYGYRDPGRSREEALIVAEQMALETDRWVWISQDLRDAFDNIPRARLFQIVRAMIPADPICDFIARITPTRNRRGIRQGGPLSPELLNVYLHWLMDLWWQKYFPDVPYIRVADDLLILAHLEEVDTLHDSLGRRVREIGMSLKHSKASAIRDLASGQSSDWLGYGISRRGPGLRITIRDKSWDKLDEHLMLAWEEPCPSLSAGESILGWIGQQGAAYRQEDVRAVYEGIALRAREKGFEEFPRREEIASRWYDAHLRDWVGRRDSLSVSTRDFMARLSDGSADQHCDLAANSGCGDVERPTGVLSQMAPTRREVFLYCDGSCLAPHGVGGWAYLLVEPETGFHQTYCGSVSRTTNNRMELTAVIQGLESLLASAHAHLVVDSEYVHRGITEWLSIWVSNGWRAGGRKTRPLQNSDLWKRLTVQLGRHYVQSCWVRGHSGHPENEYVDGLARVAAERRYNIIE